MLTLDHKLDILSEYIGYTHYVVQYANFEGLLRLAVNFTPSQLKKNFLRFTFSRLRAKIYQFLRPTATFFFLLRRTVNPFETQIL